MGPTLIGVDISPISPTIAVGATQLFTATGRYSDGCVANLTTQSMWTSSDTSIATIAGTGAQPSLASGKSVGQTTITVTSSQGSNSVHASTDLTVTP